MAKRRTDSEQPPGVLSRALKEKKEVLFELVFQENIKGSTRPNGTDDKTNEDPDNTGEALSSRGGAIEYGSVKKYSAVIAGREFSFETGKLARQANGSVLVRYGDTAVLVTAVSSEEPRTGVDFFPLTVDYEERLYSVGRIPGSWTRREGRPHEKAILAARLTDRPIRPLFPEGYRNDVQIVATVMSVDQDNSPETCAINGASAALSISDIPFMGPIAAVEVGRVDERFIINPTSEESAASDLKLTVAGYKDTVLMVEAGSAEIPEDEMLEAIMFGLDAIRDLITLQERMMSEIGRQKRDWSGETAPEDMREKARDLLSPLLDKALALCEEEKDAAPHIDAASMEDALSTVIAGLEGIYPGTGGPVLVLSAKEALMDLVRDRVSKRAGPVFADALRETRRVSQEPGNRLSAKRERERIIDEASNQVVLPFLNLGPDIVSAAKAEAYAQLKSAVRHLAVDDGSRVDGRKVDDIRPISCEVSALPRTHGSGLFVRGETQVLSVVTLGAVGDIQILDDVGEEESKRFMHHYNFPPFSVGEARPMRGPGRREIGHGALVERAIEPVLPGHPDFPYTIRIVSEVLESNGSSSMASVCGSTLALMDAGVPISRPVAGVAMGLVKQDEKTVVLTDIQGIEDALGDMDFKVAGTECGVTALQMDIKTRGVTKEVLRSALEQARRGRMKILDDILGTIRSPRPELSEYAPRIIVMDIDPEKIRDVIGPGGKTINKIIAETNTKIDIEQTGKVYIAAADMDGGNKATKMIEALTKDVEEGAIYMGKVARLTNFGAFVEILPGKEGLVRLAELGDGGYVARAEDVVSVGDEIPVKVIEIDRLGRINLSQREAVREQRGEEPRQEAGPNRGGGSRTRNEGPGEGRFNKNGRNGRSQKRR